jgi:2-polyprenyl-6-methoxyphenol hydroxylase-like FAD-dependent oxidoreductase
MTEETDVAVVGAGGGRAVLALALAKQGIGTIVLDQATGPPKGLRGGILQSNGQQVLDHLGVLSVLPVDAAHAMNPHASQGRMQAMVDAMVLSDLLPGCLAEKDYSAAKLSAFERIRGPHVTMLQQLADQQVFYWNTANQRWRFCATEKSPHPMSS